MARTEPAELSFTVPADRSTVAEESEAQRRGASALEGHMIEKGSKCQSVGRPPTAGRDR